MDFFSSSRSVLTASKELRLKYYIAIELKTAKKKEEEEPLDLRGGTNTQCLPLRRFKQCLHVGHCCANDVGIDLISKCFIPLKWHQSAQSWIMSPRVLDAPKTESRTAGNTQRSVCRVCFFFFRNCCSCTGRKSSPVFHSFWPPGFDRSPCGWRRGRVCRR